MEDIDILKEKAAELEKENKKLKKDMQFYKTIVNESDVFLHIDEIYEDKYFKMIWHNDQVKNRVGHILKEQKKGLKQYHNDSNSEDDLEAMRVVIKQINEGKLNSFSAVHKVTTKEIGSRWVYTSMVPYKKNKKGIPFQFLCTSVDLTEKMHDIERYSVMQKEILRKQNKDIIDSLTKAETEVLISLVSGKSEKEIAEIQSRSTHTIKTHIKNIHQKLPPSL